MVQEKKRKCFYSDKLNVWWQMEGVSRSKPEREQFHGGVCRPAFWFFFCFKRKAHFNVCRFRVSVNKFGCDAGECEEPEVEPQVTTVAADFAFRR